MSVNLSIITINLNNVTGLKKTIESVVNQTYSSFEFIVIDGGSSDGSVQLLEQYAEHIHHPISESDNGIYHAMNKGIQLATGSYCLFLNSGDWLADANVVESVFSENPQADIVSGDIYFYDNQLGQVKWLVPSPHYVTARTFFSGMLPHQATFIKRSLFNSLGLYNEQLKIASDWLFFLEALLVKHHTYQHYKGVVAYFNMDGISCSPETNSLPRREQRSILQQKYPLFLADYEYFDTLEKQSNQWLASREYRVYNFLERTGVIQFGVFCRRVKRSVQRNVLRLF
ncbi:glycosyltransferase [Spirosoma sp. BT702]|uniref:Glycosyltransferase n=1 Tax=Spirosoma profusum TaxID=2771354 RepID=A0A927AMX5_9BACT|nr:glycosyltransferase family 2 protein [Spirosoma profusum]MBD2700679.1 glycosyltransferase [Spirosoma profusum]